MVVKQSPADNSTHKKSADHKEKPTKKSQSKTRSGSTPARTSQGAATTQPQTQSKKKQRGTGQKEHSVLQPRGVSSELITEGKVDQEQAEFDAAAKKVTRPEDEVVTYTELEFDLKEIPAQGNQVLIGPSRLTRFEKARITGARSLQLSLGAPSLISVSPDIRDSISLAIAEIDSKALPISIRRILPNGLYQDIPIDWMKV